jgi:hypothetical protein
MSIPLFFTTTTAPPWTFTFADANGNVPPSFTSATFTLKFRSMSTGQKLNGGGSFSGANGTTGAVTYTLSSSDLTNAYAVSALGSAIGGALPGVETFEIFAEATIGSLVYDGLPSQIQIRKI